jgi:single-strand DNA-binding protein
LRALAENSASSLRKGVPVTVAGELEFRTYEKDGERREARRIVADTIGPDLRFGTAVYQRMSHGSVVAPDAGVRADLEVPVEAEAATPAYNVTSKSPVVGPPFGAKMVNDMSF